LPEMKLTPHKAWQRQVKGEVETVELENLVGACTIGTFVHDHQLGFVFGQALPRFVLATAHAAHTLAVAVCLMVPEPLAPVTA
ncbi:hypothetical protein SMA85_26305, partial [Escherichia coli]